MDSTYIKVVVLFVLVVTLSSCKMVQMNREMKETRALEVQPVDLSKIQDGKYEGSYSYCEFTYKVDVLVAEGCIQDILVKNNRDTEKAKQAELVLPRVIEKQNLDVDAHTGATTTSIALLKAIENALAGE
jgi:uncharacterized protein with FMN-binding domain